MLLVLVLLTTSVLKQREVPVTVSSSYVAVLNTAMLRTPIAAVFLDCFYFCPLDCDASVMVVDCAAVETGCMLEKYIKYFSPSPLLLLILSFASILLLLLLLRRDIHFCFLVEVLLLLIIFLVGCATAAAGAFAAYNVSTCLLYTSPSPRD